VFSQLADKFYIVLMVFLIAQYWVSATPPAGGALAEAAGALNLSIESRAQLITLLATGVYVANTIPAMVLGLVAGVWADRWRKREVMVASNGIRSRPGPADSVLPARWPPLARAVAGATGDCC